MKLDLTPVLAAFGIGLATYLILKLKRVNPDVVFKDVKYNRPKNEIHLVVENVSGRKVYVRPALRLVKLIHAEEWRLRNSGTSPIPLMSASAGSVIKGYDLIGEYALPIALEPNQTTIIKYPVMRDFGLKAYDNIRVDSPVGEDPRSLEGSVSGTVRMNFSEFLSDEYGDELLELFGSHGKIDAPAAPADCLIAALPPTEGIPAPAIHSAIKSVSPVEALCYCCGKERWLNWMVEGRHVCADCKDFLGGGATPSDSSSPIGDLEEDAELADAGLGMEIVDSTPMDLKPRHRKILDMLLEENTMSAKELSNRLGRDSKSVACDLRYLMRSSLVDRVRIRSKYKYFSLRDSEQVIIRSGEESKGFEMPKGAS
jgi:hypothetical protein